MPRLVLVVEDDLPREALVRALSGAAGFAVVTSRATTTAGQRALSLRLPAPLDLGPNRRSRERGAMLKQLRGARPWSRR